MEVFAVQNEYGSQHKSVSALEFKYCSLMNYKFPEQKFIYAFHFSYYLTKHLYVFFV